MEPLDMTKDQLIESISTPNRQIIISEVLKALDNKSGTNVMSYYEELNFMSSASSIGLLITDTGGTIYGFNKTIQDLLGISLGEYRNTNISDIYADPNDRRRLHNMLASSDTVRDFEVNVKHKNGTVLTVLANIDRIELSSGHVLLTSLYDITQYKVEQRESDKNYRTLFNNVPVGITVSDSEGELVVSNNAVQELLGYSQDELKHVSMKDFYVFPEDRQRMLALMRKIGSVRDFETIFRHKNGREVTVLMNNDSIEFNGQKGLMLTSLRDISSLKQFKEDLIKERDFSNAILNIAATLIVVLDHGGAVIRFNRACEQITGYSFGEMNGTYLWDTNLLDPPITMEEADRMLSDGLPSLYEAALISRSGERHLISWTLSSIFNSEGQVEYIIATGIDITKRQQAERALQKANRELASWVKKLQERTRETNELNEMGEQLQNCQTIAEACAISVQYIKRICPSSRGALYLINESKNFAKAAKMWGDPATQPVFAPQNCWAIRRGRDHLVDDNHPGLLCRHVTGPESGQYLCLPLMVNGEAIGILHLNQPDEPGQDRQETGGIENKAQIIISVAGHIAIALSNVKLRETLRQQSIRDVLTGLFNRRYMEETLARELNRAERENKPVGLIMFDIDHFKELNDIAGHDGGDALLRELGAYLNSTTRGGDIICRYGGDEFLAVLPGANKENTKQFAEKIRQGTKGLLVYHLGSSLAKCTISLGVSAFPEDGLTGEILLKAADNALYRAKNEGRDRTVLA